MRKNLLISLAVAAFPSLTMAQSFENLAEAEVLTGWRTASGEHIAAIKIDMADGWHTYWRAPGDAGIPPQFRFTGDPEITRITPAFPTPEVFGETGMRSVGYYDSVVFPLVVDVAMGAGDVTVKGEMFIGVCEEICIPVTLKFEATLPAQGAPDREIQTALDNRPVAASAARVGDVTCTVAPVDDGLRVTTQINVPSTGSPEHVVVEASDPIIWVSEAVTSRDGAVLSATVDMVHPSRGPFAFDRAGVRITVLGSQSAVDIRGCDSG